MGGSKMTESAASIDVSASYLGTLVYAYSIYDIH